MPYVFQTAGVASMDQIRAERMQELHRGTENKRRARVEGSPLDRIVEVETGK